MTTEYIKYFIEACNCGSILSASNKLYISSQGIGQGIKRLEKSIGIELLVRTQTGVKPTEFGKKFYEQACVVEEEMSKLYGLVEKYHTGHSTHIVVGLVEKSKYIGSVKAVADDYITMNELFRVTVSIKLFHSGTELLSELRSGKIDIGILFHRKTYEWFDYYTFKPFKRLMLVISKDHPLASRESVSWKDVKPLRMIIAGDEDPFSSLILHICRDAGFEPNNVFYTTENNFIAQQIDGNVAAILLRESYCPVICQFCQNAAVIPLKPEEYIADSVLIRANGVEEEKKRFAQYLYNIFYDPLH